MKLRRMFRGTRRYTLAAAVIVLSIFIVGFVSGRMIASRNAEKQAVMVRLNDETSNAIQKHFSRRQEALLEKHAAFVKKYTIARAEGRKKITELFNTLLDDGYCYEVLQNDSVTAWSGDAPVRNRQDVLYPDGRFTFFNSPLYVYGLAADRMILQADTLLLVTAIAFEDKAAGTDKDNTEKSFQAYLEDAFTTEILANYSPYTAPTKDGRYRAVMLHNGKGNLVGHITFKRISINTDIEALARTTSNLQGLLIVAGFILMGFALSSDFKALRFPSLKPVLFAAYFFIFRLLLFKLNFPSTLFSGDLIEPAGFASQLGGGIVKSPVEFFLTTSFFAICSAYAYFSYGKLIEGYKPHFLKRAGYIFYSIIPIHLLTVFLSLRGIAASVKSVINDSTFRYFNEPVIIPPLPQFVMVTGVLILVTSVMLLLALLFKVQLRFAPLPHKAGVLWFVIFDFIIALSLGAIFIKVQNDPLISYPVFAVLLLLLHILFYITSAQPAPLLKTILISGVISSVSGVALLNYFNSDLERESLRTTISEINRPGVEFLRFLAGEALSRAENNPALVNAYRQNKAGMDAEAYLLWNASALKQERVQSSLWLLDRSKNVTGNFSTGDSLLITLPRQLPAASASDISMQVINAHSRDSILHISGIAPITDNHVILGYLAVSIAYKQGMLLEHNVSDLLKNSPTLINNLLSPAELNIFTVKESESENLFGDFYPTLSQTEALQSGVVKGEGETWQEFEFNNEKYVVFAQNSGDGVPGSLTAVALKEKKLEWSFFNFFKLFTVHVFLILIIAGCSSLIGIFRKRSVFITFRMQLLSAFLIVSILPVIALAVFNRYATYEKSKISIRAALQANMAAVEKLALPSGAEGFTTNTAKMLLEKTGVYCNFYSANKLTASAMPYLYSTGIMPSLLSTDADYNMNSTGVKEYFTVNTYKGKEYFSLYKKIRSNGSSYIIETNSLLNQIPGQYSPVEVDVFLFGIYSLAILLVIGLSSVIANRIALPVKQLTMATRSVAHGDLRVKLTNNTYGEMRELMNGFNTMTEELQRNQAELANLEREAAWKEFARQVAHEVKNPLTPMKLTMQQLVAAYRDKSPKFDVIFEKVAATVLHQIETLNAIASEFSHFARMPVINIERIDILPIIFESITLFQNEKITITCKEETPTKLELMGDASHFRRMFINFFRNSIQAGATRISIGITVDEKITISITDDGQGIAEGTEQRIFESNFTTKSGGMGLGLKLSKRFIESLGGTITLSAGELKGACFVITLPVS